MDEPKRALTELAKPVDQQGGKRATLALLLSLLAVAASGYLAYQNYFLDEPAIGVSPDYALLQTRILKIEEKINNATQDRKNLLDEILAIKEDTNQIRQENSNLAAPPAPMAATENQDKNSAVNLELVAEIKKLEEQFAALAQTANTLKEDTNKGFQESSKALLMYTKLETIRRKLQTGLGYTDELRVLGGLFVAGREDAEALNSLNQIALQEGLSDKDLMQGLAPMETEFQAKEKMEKAEDVLDKIAVQMQKLVTIRAKNGKPDPHSAVAGIFTDLRTALSNQAWEKALLLAGQLNAKPVAGFAQWYEKLLKRTAAEAAIRQLQDVAVALVVPTSASQKISPPEELSAPENQDNKNRDKP